VWQQEHEMGATEWAPPPKGHTDIHRKHKTAISQPTIADLESALLSKPVFSIVRNPYTRILSAYLDKIVRSQPEKRYLLIGMGHAANVPVSFGDFVDFICGQHSQEMDAHYAPQAFLMQIGYVPYEKIGSVEEIEESISAIMAAGYGITRTTIGDFRPHRTDASLLVDKYYTDEIAEKVLDRFRVDFETFGYHTDRSETQLPPENLERAAKSENTSVEPILRPAIQAAVAEGNGDYAVALDLLSGIVSDEPELDVSRARALIKLGREDEAHALLQRVVKRVNNVGRYWILLSECSLAQGRAKDAAYAADRAASIAPYGVFLRRALAAWEAAGETKKARAYREKIAAIDALSL